MAAITPYLDRTKKSEGPEAPGEANRPLGDALPPLDSPCLGEGCAPLQSLSGADDYGASDESIVVTSGAGAPKLSDLAAPPPNREAKKALALAALHRLLVRVETDPMGMRGYLQDGLGKTCNTRQECQALALEYFELEVQSFREEFGEEPDMRESARPMGDFGVVTALPVLAASHANLTRMVWVRRSFEEAMLTGGPGGGPREFWIESAKTGGELVFRINPPIEGDVIPWFKGVEIASAALFGSNGKMACPTWDLPAGAPSIGGTCPGATSGQTVVEPRIRGGQLERRPDGRLFLPMPVPGETEPRELNEEAAICEQCYATEGRYPTSRVQIGEIIRYWWSRMLLDDDRAEEWITTMVRAIAALDIPRTRDGIRPIRIHSSGDFFSTAYAGAWIEVANRIWDLEIEMGRTHPEIRFWAPTRTWAARGWVNVWDKLANNLNQPNLIVRPSSYHVDDPAPGPLCEGWPMGATSVINDHNQGMSPENAGLLRDRFKDIEAARPHGGVGHDERFDWTCQTYAVDKKGTDLTNSCHDAPGPDGKMGCRACWNRPDLRINYTTH